jgi:hypothetical protein
MRNEIETKRNQINRNEIHRNETKRNKSKRNGIIQNEITPHLYEICTKNVFLICLVYFQNYAAIKKKVTMVSKHSLVQLSLYP